tara:strand:+ start:102 stop:1688 length:1587 start_codon:yes stop_codon:yes gene_type:complete
MEVKPAMKAIGYSYLNNHFNLLLPKLGVEVYQDPKCDTEKIINYGASKRKIIPGTRKIGDSPYHHMVAAIKYQGIRLHFFASIFKHVNEKELAEFISAKPNAAYNRVIWHLYEWLTGSKLPLSDLSTGNYINLFDDQFYYTLENGERDKRTRVINNAIGTKDFCPTVRKTPQILELAKVNVYDTAYSKMQSIGNKLTADIIGRSINYLYTKETKSSTEIEKETPSNQKMQRFLNTIRNAGLFELTKEKIIDIQNQIVEESKKSDDYRKEEIYVGTTIQRLGGIDEDVHYIGPLANHVESMMNGLLETHDKLMIDAKIPSLIHATLISFGEVYIHPLIDGNGRTHRYLIHDVMKQREPEHKFIIPISAAILKNQTKYDQILESISRPIMAMLDWELDSENNNKVVIKNDIDFMYRYPDYTDHVVFVYDMMNSAIAGELIEEISLLLVFDSIKIEINKVADIPNNKLDTLVSILIQGNGSISKNKQKYALSLISERVLSDIETFSTEIIKGAQKRLNVDVTKVILSSQPS